MPVTQALPDGPYAVNQGTPAQDMADVVAFLTQKGTATDAELRQVSAEVQAALDNKKDVGASTTLTEAWAGAVVVAFYTSGAWPATRPTNRTDVTVLCISTTVGVAAPSWKTTADVVLVAQ